MVAIHSGESITPSGSPPYPAALTSDSPNWHSRLAPDDSIPLIQPAIHLGRFSGNDVVIQDAGVSRLHAAIYWTPAAYVIQDLGSANGTYVDEARIEGPRALRPGQRIRIGGTVFVFQMLQVTEGQPPAGEPPTQELRSAPGPLGSHRRAGQGTVTQMPAAAVNNVAQQLQHKGFERWLHAQLPKYYWRVFLLGLAAYGAAAWILDSTGNTNTVPLVALLASAVVPVSFVVFCWEQGAFVDIPPLVLGLAFCSGSTIGLFLAAYLEGHLVSGDGVGAAIVIALCEETAKVAAVCWFLRDRRLRGEFDGLLLGAAAGMGFAALETAGYGFTFFLNSFINAAGNGTSLDVALQAGVSGMIHVLNVRLELAAFGHGVWTAIVCAAIWRERGAALFRLTPGVLLAFGIAVGLHAAWDSLGDSLLPHLVLGAAGLLVLRFFILDALEQAKRGTSAPPAPLPEALKAYFRFLWGRSSRALAAAQSYLGSMNNAQAAAAVVATQRSAGAASTSPEDQFAGQLSAPEASFCSRCGTRLGTGTVVPATS
jgi:RsiW-degrading membrane proteinase PrsW (M82 family)